MICKASELEATDQVLAHAVEGTGDEKTYLIPDPDQVWLLNCQTFIQLDLQHHPSGHL